MQFPFFATDKGRIGGRRLVFLLLSGPPVTRALRVLRDEISFSGKSLRGDDLPDFAALQGYVRRQATDCCGLPASSTGKP